MQLVNPANGLPLERSGDCYVDRLGNAWPLIGGVARFAGSNYASNFGFQWNRHRETQLDTGKTDASAARFFAQSGWSTDSLDGLDVLEVGSGAGRFSRVVLEQTGARLWSVDYSSAVDANMASNGSIAPDRFALFQASIYEMPFADSSFDRVFCFGVLQHTPDVAASVKALVAKARPGGEIAVDFYPLNGWWTWLQGKYIALPFTRRMDNERLHALIEAKVDGLMRTYDLLDRIGLGALNRLLPLANLRAFPASLSPAERREWAVMDTFDALSPAYDQPQRVADVATMFEAAGARVTWAGKLHYTLSDGSPGQSAVVRGVRL